MTTTLSLAKVLFPALAGIAAFCYYMAHLAEKGSSELTKQQLRQLLLERKLLPAMRGAFVYFLRASDRYFGPKLFSWKALIRSVVLSIFWTTGVLAACIALYPNYSSWLGSNISRKLILQSAGVLLAASLVADYLCVCVTRAIARAAVGKGRLWLMSAVAIDLVASVLVFYFLFTAAKLLVHPGNGALGLLDSLRVWLNPAGLPIGIELLQPLSADMLVSRGGGNFDIKGGLLTEIVYAFPEPVLFLSSLLTSVWLWLYVLGYLILFAAVRLDRIGVSARKFLKVAEDPINSLALAIVIASAVLFAIILASSAIADGLAYLSQA
ncbi:hypothetical protein [Polaromonas sp.]|uniref:hypothetical protein n=1 Tax=Polaromonas sp. TaxID=1869339 RepID=UPI002FC65E08